MYENHKTSNFLQIKHCTKRQLVSNTVNNMKRNLLVVIIPLLFFSIAQVVIPLFSDGGDGGAGGQSGEEVAWSINLSYFSYIVSGYLAGYICQSRNFVWGLIAGLLCSLVSIFFFSANVGGLHGGVTLIIIGTILGGLGGIFSKFDMNYRNTRI